MIKSDGTICTGCKKRLVTEKSARLAVKFGGKPVFCPICLERIMKAAVAAKRLEQKPPQYTDLKTPPKAKKLTVPNGEVTVSFLEGLTSFPRGYVYRDVVAKGLIPVRLLDKGGNHLVVSKDDVLTLLDLVESQDKPVREKLGDILWFKVAYDIAAIRRALQT